MISDALWELARVIHIARMRLCYGNDNETRQPFPMTTVERRSYPHNPNTWVDQALAIAKAISAHPDAVLAVQAAIKEAGK